MKQLPRLFLHALLALMAALGAVFCVTTAFDLAVNEGVIALVCLCSSLLGAACFLWKKCLWSLPLLVVLGVVLGMFTGLFDPVVPTLLQLTHDLLTRFSSAYPNMTFVIPQAPAQGLPQDMTLLMSLLGILLTLWMAWGVGYRSCIISVSGTLPFLLLCVFINDTPPHVGPLILLMSVWLTVLLCKERPQEPQAMDTARLGIVLMAVVLLLSIVGTLYPKEDSQPLPEVLQDLVDRLPGPVQNALSRESTGFQEEELGADTSLTLDLTTQGTRERKDTVMLQVSSTQTGVLYLRGAAKDIYTGSSWESRNEAGAVDSIYAQTSLGTTFGGSLQAAVEVTNLQEKATVAFVPYGFISCTGAEDIISDLRVPCAQKDYIDYFWPDLQSLDLTTAQGEALESYDQYVAATCLQLPEDTQTALYDLALRYGYDPDLSTLETIAWVAEFVRTVGQYDLGVARQPANADFALYFLTQSQAGYCVHFATAAATMCRALGIPARYASGYRVTIDEAGGVTQVTDQDTHAWAEVYLSGLGWLPLETTPGFGTSLDLPEVAHAPALQETLETEAAPSPSPAEEPEPSPEPEETTAPTPQPETEQEPGPSQDPSEALETPGAAGTATGVRPMAYPWLLAIPTLVLLLLILLPLRRAMVLGRRKKKWLRAEPNQAVILQWQYLERLEPWGATLPPDLEALALKAKFSQHQITPEERNTFHAAGLSLAEDTRTALPTLRRLRFQFLHCLG